MLIMTKEMKMKNTQQVINYNVTDLKIAELWTNYSDLTEYKQVTAAIADMRVSTRSCYES